MKHKKKIIISIFALVGLILLMKAQKKEGTPLVEGSGSVNPVQNQTLSQDDSKSIHDQKQQQNTKLESVSVSDSKQIEFKPYTNQQSLKLLKRRLHLSNHESMKYQENDFDTNSVMIAHGLTKVTKKSVDEIVKLKTDPPRTWLEVFKELKIRDRGLMAKIMKENQKEYKRPMKLKNNE